MATSKVTADFMVDRLEELFPELLLRCPGLETLVINADNGCESSGSRTQWLKRLVEFSRRHNICIQLAYYPPYHSKYNAVERCWGVLENHWRGEILGSVEKVLGLARSMRYAGIKPVVKLVRKVYRSGVKVIKSEMEEIESSLQRNPRLKKWFVKISPE
jgi:transposase